MYRDYIDALKKEWRGQRVRYDGQTYMVTDVDYNGALLIDKQAQFTDTTAVLTTMVEKIKPGE